MRPALPSRSWSGVVGSFALLLVGAALLGSTTAVNNQSRYAATDLARPSKRAGALSLVVWATTIGAVAGPNLAGYAGGVAADVGLPPLTGPFLFGLAGMLVFALVIVVFLRPDPLLVARAAAVVRRRPAPHSPDATQRFTRVCREFVASLATGPMGSDKEPWEERPTW